MTFKPLLGGSSIKFSSPFSSKSNAAVAAPAPQPAPAPAAPMGADAFVASAPQPMAPPQPAPAPMPMPAPAPMPVPMAAPAPMPVPNYAAAPNYAAGPAYTPPSGGIKGFFEKIFGFFGNMFKRNPAPAAPMMTQSPVGMAATVPMAGGMPMPGPAAPAAPANPWGPVPGRYLPPLSTVPDRPEYKTVPVNTAEVGHAIISTLRWVKAYNPQHFIYGADVDMSKAGYYAVITEAIGILRAHGYDAHRVVNHPSYPVGDPRRYGADALVVNGYIYDVIGQWSHGGESDPFPSLEPQALNNGPYVDKNGYRPRE